MTFGLNADAKIIYEVNLPIYPQTGTHFELHAAQWALIDENDLMQRSLRRHSPASGIPKCGLELPQSRDQTGEHSSFCFNAAAAPFDPSRPPIATQPDFVQDLFAWWDFAAFSWEGEDRSTKILTFFVDHRTPPL